MINGLMTSYMRNSSPLYEKAGLYVVEMFEAGSNRPYGLYFSQRANKKWESNIWYPTLGAKAKDFDRFIRDPFAFIEGMQNIENQDVDPDQGRSDEKVVWSEDESTRVIMQTTDGKRAQPFGLEFYEYGSQITEMWFGSSIVRDRWLEKFHSDRWSDILTTCGKYYCPSNRKWLLLCDCCPRPTKQTKAQEILSYIISEIEKMGGPPLDVEQSAFNRIANNLANELLQEKI